MIRPHHAMDDRLWADLQASDLIQRPMPIRWEETREARCAEKPVLKSRLLDDMQSLDNWETVTEYAHLELADTHALSGEHSIKFTAPCRLDHWEGNVGRIYTVPKAFRRFDRENWEAYNQLSAWVYPDMPGYRNVCLRLQLHNDGEHVVPDAFDREGGHNVNLINHQWNHITFEIPYVARDEVIGVSFDYDMVGHEPCATDTACWYLGKLELQEVETELYEGWEVGKGRVAFSHSGYQTGADKTAIASDLAAERFSLLDEKTGQAVYEGPVQDVTTTTGTFRVMDFTDFRTPGRYRIQAGDITTQPFAINDYIWMGSIWKTINFFFSQRCGYHVPGKHNVCHGDQVTVHGDKSIICNGGWHDAADTNQQFPLTCETTYAFFDLALAVKDEDPLLYRRLMSEGVWGLDYLLKGRFGDGYRVGPASSAVWTDGIRGTVDDLTYPATNTAFENLLAASAEAIGYRAMLEDDPAQAHYALRCAREDFAFGVQQLDDGTYDPTAQRGHDRMNSKCLMAGVAAQTALELYRITQEDYYAQRAAEFGDYIVSCQQRRYIDGFSEPLVGFYYRDPNQRTVIHYNHRSHEEKYTVALIELCRQLPDHPHWMDWHSALLFHADYVKRSMRFVAPYGMVPSGIHALDEIDDRDTFTLMHPLVVVFAGLDYEGQLAQTFKNFREQLENGVQVGPQHYMRRFPVWYSFRGNYHVQLSMGKAVSASSVYLNDADLYNIAQQQFEWIIGKNPFAESVMFGEGYDYGQQYAVLHGDAVGELPVGMQSNEERDAPFWPQAINCTYKEVWVAAPGKWLWMMADEYLPGRVVGHFSGEDARDVAFTNEATGQTQQFPLEGGRLDIRLPAGTYRVVYGAQQRRLSVVAGRTYTLRVPLASFAMEAVREGDDVVLTLTGPDAPLELRMTNLKTENANVTLSGGKITVRCTVEDTSAPWAVAVIPDNQFGEVLSAMG